MFRYGEVISYMEMCQEEGASLQRGMNFRLKGNATVVLMSQRPNAPYTDEVQGDGQILIYEGHDISQTANGPDPKSVDQPMFAPSGRPTQNGLFFNAAQQFKDGLSASEIVKVYEKIYPGIWVFNGLFQLTDAWLQHAGHRSVFKFQLELIEPSRLPEVAATPDNTLEHNRIIPSDVKLAVWKRDQGRCVKCGSTDNLHFDHILPYSLGGTSLLADNIQLLCARHNLSKGNKIE